MAPSSTAASSNTHLTKSNKSSAFELREIGDDGHQRHAQDASNDSAGASTSSHRLSHVDQSSEYLQGPGLTPPESLADRNESQLPPVDGGKDAWLFLAACFLIEALVWGFAFTFGVFQEYYSRNEPFIGEKNIAVIGTMAMGIMYLDLPVVFALLQMHPRLKRWATALGLVIMCLGLALSSFSRNTTHLILTQGIFYAIGGSIAYAPTILYMDEWFVKRKGFAFGIMWAGTGLSGVILPIVMQWLLDKWGFATTLRIWGVACFVLTAPLTFYVKPRIPISQAQRVRSFNLRFLYKRPFALLQLGNVLEGLGFFLPNIYLPTYASTVLGTSSLLSSLTVVLFNVASVFGCIAMGYIIDRVPVTTGIFISTVGATVGVFLLWGFALNLPLLYVFCIVYGFFAGSFTSTWPGIMRDVTNRMRGAVDPSMVFACLAAGRGIGNVVSGPLSEALVEAGQWKAGWAYGSGYGALIVFTGISALLGGLSCIGRFAPQLL
ncbi:Major facilitator superfamily [Macrophomina phaseolina MS6]|uniref:Major facilitator superfamily n=1 Tax=Macrophomina phaseolina (strain MS6) TaxID=1126212 RepID=K2RBI1_MACPH|nr:Major facilitator superfamily [Macrophomina phaseolina MS6]